MFRNSLLIDHKFILEILKQDHVLQFSEYFIFVTFDL